MSEYDGVVTLAGTVGSVRQKREAEKAAGRVHGVVLVNNELDVRIRTDARMPTCAVPSCRRMWASR